MSMVFFAGVDGGGTKTRLRCVTREGKVVREEVFDSFNYNSIGEASFRALLSKMTAVLCQTGDCKGLLIGCAGISNREMMRILHEEMEKAAIPLAVRTDGAIALEGALDGAPGIALIAGTGSICLGKARDGHEERSGGWGHLIGDEGSGYALGRDALIAVTKEMDGYGPATMLTQLVADKEKLTDRSALISYAYGGDKSRIAALSVLTQEAAEKGDDVALAILTANARALCATAFSVADKLELQEADLALLGGLFEHDTLFRRELIRLTKELRPKMRCMEPLHDALYGAVSLSLRTFA